MRYTILIERDDDEGLFGVTVPAVPGCVTQGETVDEAMANAREAITGHIAALHDLGEPVPIEVTPPIMTAIDIEPAAKWCIRQVRCKLGRLMRRSPVPLLLRAHMMFGEEEATIERLARSRTAPARLVERARIVRSSRQGDTVAEIAAALGICQDTVRRWINRFDRHGVAGLAPPASLSGPALAGHRRTQPRRLGWSSPPA